MRSKTRKSNTKQVNQFFKDKNQEQSAVRNEMKHTPGPWFVEPKYRSIESEQGHIATVGFMDMSLEDQRQKEANAYLIAAAPEMRKLLGYIEARLPDIVKNKALDEAYDLWERVRDTIAKAEGKE